MSLPYRISFKFLPSSRIAAAAVSTAKPGSTKVQQPGQRRIASHSSLGGSKSSSRKQITIASDDGRVQWGELSKREKAARTTQQSFNFFVILTGVVMTVRNPIILALLPIYTHFNQGAVFTFLYQEVFASESKTSQFNRAFDQVRKDTRCVELLGKSKKIRAYGEPTSNKWSRNRPIASRVEKDRSGLEHLFMHFNVEGPLDKGVVNIHMTRRASNDEYEYKYLALDVKGMATMDWKLSDLPIDVWQVTPASTSRIQTQPRGNPTRGR
ncbi:MAG: mitochondrial import inner membrane translocase subunit tim21 [Sclerophora amabilis]|nr:MAG: mitochondrial import inner membrane translocase subunit tim21 [Sclerophora amabilis]